MVAVGMNDFQMQFGDDSLTILRSIREGAVFPNRDHARLTTALSFLHGFTAAYVNAARRPQQIEIKHLFESRC